MNISFAALLLLGMVTASAQTYTLDSFDAEMTRIESALARSPAGVGATLPVSWDIDVPGHRYTISSAPLQNSLKAADPNASREWIAQLRRHLQAFEILPSAVDDAGDQAALKSVLAREQFQNVEPPNEWQLFVRRIIQAIAEWFSVIGAFVEQHPSTSSFLFWTLIVGGVVGLGVWLFRVWSESDHIPSLQAGLPSERSLRPWQEWLQEARRAADQGDHRQAIRCGYWAGIARLQQNRTVPLNFAVTPRERLRLLAQPKDVGERLPAAQLEPLTGITTSLERFWYAKVPATAEDVAHTFRNLEGLECKVD